MSKERSIRQYEEDRISAARHSGPADPGLGHHNPPASAAWASAPSTSWMTNATSRICARPWRTWPATTRPGNFSPRDAVMLRDADAVLLITSLRCLNDPADINCNMCGHITCEYQKEAERLPAEPSVAFTGPLCTFRANNIAYGLDGMISQARNLGIDYGVFWSAGAAAMRMGILPKETGFALGLAISITEKSPFRDIPKRLRRNQRTDHERPHHPAAVAPVPVNLQLGGG